MVARSTAPLTARTGADPVLVESLTTDERLLKDDDRPLLASFEALADICARSVRPVAFSLDLRNGTPMNTALATRSPDEIAQRAVESGAQTIIALDVARVGVAGGPDFDLLRRIRSAVPGADIFVGGGIRHLDDLREVSGIGCAGALVATALHEGRLTPADVETARRF